MRCIFIEIKIPKEVRQHSESIFFGLSVRQFFCSACAVGLAVGIYLLLGPIVGTELAGWFCILAAAPLAAAGFFRYNSLNLEGFFWAVLKSQILCAGNRPFVSENLYYDAMIGNHKKRKKHRKGGKAL